MKERLYSWSQKFIHKPHAEWFLGLFSFLESIIVPLPTDVILMSMVLLRRQRWLRYAIITVTTSVLGGIAVYYLGQFFFDIIREPLFNAFHLQDEFVQIQQSFANNTFIAMLTAAFTMIPYKVVAVAGGVFKVNIFSFIAASLVGRALRFGVEAYLVYRFGHIAGRTIYKHFSSIVIALIVIAVVLVIVL